MSRLSCVTITSAFALCVAAFILPETASAQCALCRAAAENAGEATGRALNLGILILLVPPVAIFCAIYFAALKSGDGEK